MYRTQAPPPYQVAPDTFIIPELFPAGPDTVVPVNSAVITGPEPIIIDTGTRLNRDRWLDAAWSIVDPADVRWVFLSHDDHDHVGNLMPVLEACPNATLVTHWFSVMRLFGDYELDPRRMRWVNDGETFDAGGRTFVALRPPLFDAPTTRGLFDPKTGFYWAGDCFGSLLPEHVTDVADAEEFWTETFAVDNSFGCPWHSLVDERKFNARVDLVAQLPLTTLATAHGAPIHGRAHPEGDRPDARHGARARGSRTSVKRCSTRSSPR